MLNRREILKLALASWLVPAAGRLHAWKLSQPLGVQLYTVRRLLKAHLKDTLAAIRKIGYSEVETYWDIYDRPAKELRQLLADNGLRAPSGHFDYEGLAGKIDYAAELGLRYVVCPILPVAMRTSIDGFKKAAAQFNQWGADVRQRGMNFVFHNHNYEFRSFAGTTGFAMLLAETDPKLVWLEMDCYWIAQAGLDPVQVLNQHADRIKLLHLKDRQPGFPFSQTLDKAAGHFTELGNGSLDWNAILAAASQNRVEHIFVEQDESTRDPVESLRISFRYLQNLA